MIILLLGVFLASFLFLRLLLTKREPLPVSFNGRPCKAPPTLPAKYFGIQNIINSLKANREHRLPLAVIDFFNEYGNTVSMKRLGARSVMTRDYRNVQAVLATQFDDFGLAPDRKSHHPVLGTQGIFTQDGPEWKASRALLRPAFDHAQVADLGALETFVKRMISRIESSYGTDNFREVDLNALLLDLTMDSSTDFLLGISTDAQEGKVTTGGPMSFSEAFTISQDYVSLRFTFNSLYWLINPKRFRVACSVVHKLVGRYVSYALQRASSKDKPYSKDTSESGKYIFLEALAQQTQNPQVLQDQILSVMLAGRDTTASLLTWSFLSLARNPGVLRKLRDEISETLGIGADARCPTQDELRSMVYLKWFIHEVLRLYPPVPFNSRRALRSTTLPYGGGPDGNSPIAIQKGERVVYSVLAVQRRTDIYGDDACEFRPERWGEEGLRKVGWGWLPFNGGPRICLGQQMALTQAMYVTVRILQGYGEFIEAGKMGNGIDEGGYALNLTMSPGKGLKVKMR